MNTQRILEELLGLLESNGVIIRHELLGGEGGGLCSMKKEWIFFLDTQAPSEVTAAICAEALPGIVDIEHIYIKPEVRQFIELHSGSEKEQI